MVVEKLLKVALFGASWVMYLMIALSVFSIGAMIERLDFLRLLIAGRQHDDRRCVPFAQPAQHHLTIEVGQAEVEDDDVGGHSRRDAQALFAPRGFAEPIALVGQ